MEINQEYKIAKVIFLASFVTLLIEVIIATDVYVPVDWNHAVIPSAVYLLVVRHYLKSRESEHDEVKLFALEVSRFFLITSSGLSFVFHLRELLGPCGISHKTLLEQCSNVSRLNPETMRRCEYFLKNANSYFIDQNKCPWVVLGNAFGSLFYAIMFLVRVGLAIILPAFVEIVTFDRRRFAAVKVFDYQSILYACGSLIVVICLLLETLSSIAVHYPLFNIEPCVFYILGAYMCFISRSEPPLSTNQNIWVLCVSVTFLYGAVDFFRNYLLYSISICSENFNLDHLCRNEDSSRCLKQILASSETISRLYDCPNNKLGPIKAKIVRNCQLCRFIVVIFHQGLTLALQRPINKPVVGNRDFTEDFEKQLIITSRNETDDAAMPRSRLSTRT